VIITRNKAITGLAFCFVSLIMVGCNQGENCPFVLNPDVSCRVLDKRADGTLLIEYFNVDTNELKLALKNKDGEIQIEHPMGKVANFKSALNENQIVFGTNEYTIVVNGEKFPITLTNRK
jgi:hypothetical protein